MIVIIDKTYNLRRRVELPDNLTLEQAKQQACELADETTFTFNALPSNEGGIELELIGADFMREPTEEELRFPERLDFSAEDLGANKPLVNWFDVDY